MQICPGYRRIREVSESIKLSIIFSRKSNLPPGFRFFLIRCSCIRKNMNLHKYPRSSVIRRRRVI